MDDAGRILAVANQKGGVGKTTTVINLGAYLGELGHKVLLVDCDPQANTTRSIMTADDAAITLYGVLIEARPMSEAIISTDSANVDLVPGSPDLAGAEIELLNLVEREKALNKALESVSATYNFILLDCPPSLGLLTVNALAAADAVLVPVQCEYLALEGVTRLMDTISRIRANLNPRLRIFGLVMTMYDKRLSLSTEVAAEVRKHYPELLFQTVIPRNVKLSEAPSHRKPILAYDPNSVGAEAYSNLAKEVAARG